jgi:hypothetical protein
LIRSTGRRSHETDAVGTARVSSTRKSESSAFISKAPAGIAFSTRVVRSLIAHLQRQRPRERTT